MSPSADYSARWSSQRGTRPARIANCSGAKPDPGWQMLRQATEGDVDFITGDYLAEMNLAENAEGFAAGKHEGFEPTAWDGIQLTIDVLAEKRIKLVINGGSLNPSGLAKKTQELAQKKNLDLSVAYVSGDDLLPEMREMLDKTGKLPPHLEPEESGVQLAKNAHAYTDKKNKPLVSANAYLGARAIVKGLELGADIIICGRVADASPVIGAAWYWHSWSDNDYDRLAGALVAGHLIECSGYVTGSNFSGFTDYPLENFVDIAYGIAEVSNDGTCVITKHEETNGMVNSDTVICQFLYELQGDIYLNSDVKAYTSEITVQDIGPDRVRVAGIKGAPPPPTTKLAIFYKGGYQSEYLTCATGYGTAQKWDLQERQIRHGLAKKGLLDSFEILEFQNTGTATENPRSQLQSTTWQRIVAQADTVEPIYGLLKTAAEYSGMQHFSGMHGSLDRRNAFPLPFVAFYPATIPQDQLQESITFLSTSTLQSKSKPELNAAVSSGHPPRYEELERRSSYDTSSPITLTSLGPTRPVKLGDICLARSGDKGANVNFGIYPRATSLPSATREQKTRAWDWLRTFLSLERMELLLGDDWKETYKLERVEFPNIYSVHFVVYGLLGRGVSSATTLDPLGKGFADYMRDKVVQAPVSLLDALTHIGLTANGTGLHRVGNVEVEI